MPYVYDDHYWMHISLTQLTIGTAPFSLAEWIGGGRPWAPHAMVLLLHLLNGVLVWRLAQRWMSDHGALFALALFWLHPLSLQAVFYVTAGREVWVGTVALIATLAGVRGGVIGWPVGLAALGAAAAVKTSALPVLLVVPTVWAATRSSARVLLIAGLCVGLSSAIPWARDADAIRAWAVALWGGLRLIAWPDALSLLHDWRAVSAPLGWIAVAMLAALGVIAWRLSRAAWWAWAWVVGLTLPRALIHVPPEPSAPLLTEAHLYLPCLAIWLACGAGLETVLKGPYGRTRCV